MASEKDVEKGHSSSSDDGRGCVLDKKDEAELTIEADTILPSPQNPKRDEDVVAEPMEGNTTTITATPKSPGRLSKLPCFGSRSPKTPQTPKPDPIALPREPLPVTDLEAGIVGWDSQDDPSNPLNFSPSRKWLTVTFLSLITFMTPFASSILAPGITTMATTFGTQDDLILSSLPVSIFLLGYAVGPLFLAPLSEIYGRHPVLSISNAFFSVMLIGCALAPSLEALVVFRFLSGIGGSACMTLGSGIIADLFPVHERGRALSAWSIGPLIGPCIGPLVGAFLAESRTLGWRWDFWISLIPAVIITVVIAVFSKETYAVVLINKKLHRFRQELNRPELRSCYAPPGQTSDPKLTTILARGLSRPLKLLIFSPLILGLSLYIAFAYGTLYLLFNTVPLVFTSVYAFSTSQTGLLYLPLGFGFLFGLFIFSKVSDRTLVRLAHKNAGVSTPEMRLPDCIIFACILPITFFVYGWCAHFQTHWVFPVLGLVPYGVGMIGIWQPVQAYIIDAYPVYAASASAGFTVTRSLVAAFLPLAGPAMYEGLGLGWGNSVLGFVCVGMIPMPVVIYRFGGRLRARWKVDL